MPPPDLNSRLDRFLDDYERDRDEGMTVRSLHERLSTHEHDDQRRFDELRDRIAAAQVEAAKASSASHDVNVTVGGNGNGHAGVKKSFFAAAFESRHVWLAAIAAGSVVAHAIIRAVMH